MNEEKDETQISFWSNQQSEKTASDNGQCGSVFVYE